MCTEEFYESFKSGVGSHCITCGCGITHFSYGGGWACSEEEYQSQVRAQKESPDKFVVMDIKEVASLVNLGTEYVYDCPCGIIEKHEKWIWANRHRIQKYLKLRAAIEIEKISKEQDLLSQF